MFRVRLIPLAFVAIALLWLSAKGDALTCRVGGDFEIHNKTAFANANDSTLGLFLHDMEIIQRFPLLVPEFLSFANWTSQDCGSLPHFKGQNVEEFACAEVRFCHADVTGVVKSCFPKRELEEALEKKGPGCSFISNDKKGWRMKACGCNTSDCNRNWEKLAGICLEPEPSVRNNGTALKIGVTPPTALLPVESPAPKVNVSTEKGNATLTCHVGGLLQIRNDSAFANTSLSWFLDFMRITKKIRDIPRFDDDFFTNWTSKACDKREKGFACAQMSVCHEDVQALAKFCMPLSTNWPRPDHHEAYNSGVKGLRFKLATCASSDCNHEWKELPDADCFKAVQISNIPTSGAAFWSQGFDVVQVAAFSALVVLFSL